MCDGKALDHKIRDDEKIIDRYRLVGTMQIKVKTPKHLHLLFASFALKVFAMPSATSPIRCIKNVLTSGLNVRKVPSKRNEYESCRNF